MVIFAGCAGEGKVAHLRTGQLAEPPIFNSLNWPEPFSELPGGSLVITGNMECEGGYYEEIPIFVYIFPFALIPVPSLESGNKLLPGGEGQKGEELKEGEEIILEDDIQQLLEAGPMVQQWMAAAREEIFIRVTTGESPEIEYEEAIKGMQAHCLYTPDFNEFQYFDFETGNFRIDFDKFARFNSGRLLLMVCGVDADAQVTIRMNVFTVPVLSPELLAELDSNSISFANRITGLGNALIDVLATSGDGRAADIGLMVPYINLFAEAYGGGYRRSTWDTAAGNFLGASEAASDLLTGYPLLKEGYEETAESIADVYEFLNFLFWTDHIVEKEEDDDLLTMFQTATQQIVDKFNHYNGQYYLEERGNGVKALTCIIYEGEDLFGQLEIIGDPTAPLYVTGFIGNHIIIEEDYNPFFIQIFQVFEEEGYEAPLFI